MKVYLFDSENGLYAGVTYQGPDRLQTEDGITAIPPPEYQSGQVPVFDHQQQEWVVIPTTIARQLLHPGLPRSQETPA